MYKKYLPWVLLAVGLILGAVFLFIAVETGGPHLARGVPITTAGYSWLITTGLGSLGTIVSSLLAAIFSKPAAVGTSGQTSTPTSAEMFVEFASAFASWRYNRSPAALRRFAFAAGDLFSQLSGFKVSYDAGVLTIQYFGFAGAQQGAKQGAQIGQTVPAAPPAPASPNPPTV